MNTRLHPPVSRLICFGRAKASTNAVIGSEGEAQPELGFGE